MITGRNKKEKKKIFSICYDMLLSWKRGERREKVWKYNNRNGAISL